MLVDITDNFVKYTVDMSPLRNRIVLYQHPNQTDNDLNIAVEEVKRDLDKASYTIEKVNEETWLTLKLFLHPEVETNNRLNNEYHTMLRRKKIVLTNAIL